MIDLFSEEFTYLQNIRVFDRKLASHLIIMVGHLNKEAECIAVPGLPPGERRVLVPILERSLSLASSRRPCKRPGGTTWTARD
jgi:hypothetical protein